MNEKNKRNGQYYIEQLEMQKHPEGGYFKEAYRSDEHYCRNELPKRYKSDRKYATSIYFLLQNEDKSHFHRLQSDEIWHFYDGDPLLLFVIYPDGKLEKVILGRDLERGEQLQFTVPRDTWFAAEVENNRGFSLLGCTVAPGFEFDDFELANKAELLQAYPDYEEIIFKFAG